MANFNRLDTPESYPNWASPVMEWDCCFVKLFCEQMVTKTCTVGNASIYFI